ncbi:MAG: hypothetical protein KAH10_05530 [Flavobacteriales bacterium]|nr:hypothetical protein [Flavobacteriales bacterium]
MNTISIVRWTARIIGSLLVLFTLIIGVGEMLQSYNNHGVLPFSKFSILMIVTFIFWIAGLAGLILAFWKETKGGLFSLLNFIIFITLVAINSESNFSYNLYIYLVPSLLYIYCGYLETVRKH